MDTTIKLPKTPVAAPATPAATPAPGTSAPVALAACPSYERGDVTRAVGEVFASIGYAPSGGERVLIKPNLLRAEELACTHPEIVRAACAYVLDHGARPVIADSPGFGTVRGIARRVGILAALADLPGAPAPIPLRDPVPVPLFLNGRRNGTAGISRTALEADSILNLPRLKAHAMMRVTCAVKNLYGCVCGVRKALLHASHGGKGRSFPASVMDIATALLPVTSLLDAVTAMHVSGPSGGEPYSAGLLAASDSPVAMDTLIYGMMGLTPDLVPLWEEALFRAMPGSRPEAIPVLGADKESFSLREFKTPDVLMDQSFSPPRLLASALRRVWTGVTG